MYMKQQMLAIVGAVLAATTLAGLALVPNTIQNAAANPCSGFTLSVEASASAGRDGGNIGDIGQEVACNAEDIVVFEVDESEDESAE
jgi:hypothetical protein